MPGIWMHECKTKMWNRAGLRSDVCDRFEMMAVPVVILGARVWRGSILPNERQGIKVIGTPLGRPNFVARHLHGAAAEHQILFNRIPLVTDF